ncbi:hypothetical protein A2673_03295 [Candidatus Kaiserbacteria bacterium RIFCSPHIGHO2_01_FULL_50_13]|uniref:30S ribosomal protein S21 n=1 Tax=Candidatus Kaiserbacteria bacterium RIFCSPLOWO2_01_FULL_50_24 TaxID=1798507 RepID=A0A1F6EIP0_9BACT|nr:MAG: hypothetical protein A2673_03295 [Candidatus Kaiserbacteria bacterium RIFCSPHIGHO2_01_FULL_50_13]OGG73530.1 MAG: hypothetical protein A3A34_01135 [Candidatus Kaiserbacteria bacterium RIFCSPLOWO2_01_FULL_50_24]OGG81578.1 MAG: hypothetical protein A3H74_00670 [Candidatus Kaiserbacteria bacterium RIFCSPLOWO2_02_FULL_51_13]
MVQAEIVKLGNETVLSTIRKFSRRVQGAGVIKTVRRGRYFTRIASKTVKKKRTLKMLKRRKEYQRLIKEGKIAEPTPRTSSHREQSSGPRRATFGESTPIAH